MIAAPALYVAGACLEHAPGGTEDSARCLSQDLAGTGWAATSGNWDNVPDLTVTPLFRSGSPPSPMDRSIAPGAARVWIPTLPRLPKLDVKRRAQHWMRREKGPRPLSVQFKSSPAISSTSWTMRRRSPGSFIRMNALVSASPSVVARKSET